MNAYMYNFFGSCINTFGFDNEIGGGAVFIKEVYMYSIFRLF